MRRHELDSENIVSESCTERIPSDGNRALTHNPDNPLAVLKTVVKSSSSKVLPCLSVTAIGMNRIRSNPSESDHCNLFVIHCWASMFVGSMSPKNQTSQQYAYKATAWFKTVV